MGNDCRLTVGSFAELHAKRRPDLRTSTISANQQSSRNRRAISTFNVITILLFIDSFYGPTGDYGRCICSLDMLPEGITNRPVLCNMTKIRCTYFGCRKTNRTGIIGITT